MNTLKAFLDKIILLDKEEWKAFSSLFSEAILRKGEYFSIEGRIEANIGFLLNGVIRAYYRNNTGIEYNKTFFTDHEFFGAYSSLVSGKPNKINLQALTDCTVYVANYKQITKLFKRYQNIESLARLLAEQFYIEKEKREIEVVLLEAKDRYKLFKQEYPGLENLIPQYHIASYLGVTPTQLSRIRGRKK